MQGSAFCGSELQRFVFKIFIFTYPFSQNIKILFTVYTEILTSVSRAPLKVEFQIFHYRYGEFFRGGTNVGIAVGDGEYNLYNRVLGGLPIFTCSDTFVIGCII